MDAYLGERVLSETSVEDGIRDLITDLVGVALTNGLGSEKEAVSRQGQQWQLDKAKQGAVGRIGKDGQKPKTSRQQPILSNKPVESQKTCDAVLPRREKTLTAREPSQWRDHYR